MAAAKDNKYLDILKAEYDYTAQGEDEVTVIEDQLVFLLDNSDPEWSKVKVKPKTQDEEGPVGLLPANYLQPAAPIATVKALYDYEATAEDELTIAEDDALQVFAREEDWTLIKTVPTKGQARIGYVPSAYLEEAGEEAPDAASSEPVAAPAAIVIPDSPPRPPYVDPAERAAAASANAEKLKQDPVKTWSVSYIDKKGKKKKGTLGVGNGALFFASESDKTPVQQWKSADIRSVTLNKKDIELEVGGPTPDSLHFLSKDASDEIVAKIKSSRGLADPAAERPSTSSERPSTSSEPPRSIELPTRTSEAKSVHWSTSPASEIPPRTPTPSDGDEPSDGIMGVVMYDFTGDATDELTVKESEILMVIDRTNPDWWKCRNQKGAEGVVPAQYIDLDAEDEARHNAATNGHAHEEVDDEEERRKEEAAEEEERRQREKEARQEKERKEKEKKEKEKKERERKERERKEQERIAAEERERAAAEERRSIEREKAEDLKKKAAAAAAAKKKAAETKEKAKRAEPPPEEDDEDDSGSTDSDDEVTRQIREKQAKKRRENDARRQSGVPAGSSTPRPSSSGSTRQGRPPEPGKTRIWHDRTGQFRVEAEFKGFDSGKLRLLKLNGVTIEVPSEKMSAEDLEYVAKATGKKSKRDEDNIPLAELRPKAGSSSSSPAAQQQVPTPPPKKHVDWFKFFLDAGCDMDDCTRYATAFDKDKIDEKILPDLQADTLRRLGLREGDVIRVTKAIEKRQWSAAAKSDDPSVKRQIEADAEYAKAVQQAIILGKQPPPPPGPVPMAKTVSPAPNIFTTSTGALKDSTRRGRPTPNTAARQASLIVSDDILGNASAELSRGTSPALPTSPVKARVASPTGVAAPKPVVPAAFEDDAWTVRPGSAKPTSPAVAVTPPIPPASAPPAPAPPPAPVVAPAVSVVPPERPGTTPAVAPAPANTEQDLLEKIALLRRPASANPAMQAAVAQPTFASHLVPQMTASPPIMSTTTSFVQTPITAIPAFNPSAPRGPFAPVPVNQELLRPLIPTTTGFNGMVPTRPGGIGVSPSPLLPAATGMHQSPFLNPAPMSMMTGVAPQMTGFVPSMAAQPTGFVPSMVAQPTGFVPSMTAQPTGFMGSTISPFQPQPTGYMMSQPTGMNFGGMGMGMNNNVPPVPSLPSNFINQSPFGIGTLSPPPMLAPVAPAAPAAPDHSPANVFASMKAGNFGGPEQQAGGPEKYDALRGTTGPIQPQATGWAPGLAQQQYQNSFGFR